MFRAAAIKCACACSRCHRAGKSAAYDANAATDSHAFHRCIAVRACFSVLPVELRPYASLYNTAAGYPYSDPMQLVRHQRAATSQPASRRWSAASSARRLSCLFSSAARWRCDEQLSRPSQPTAALRSRSNLSASVTASNVHPSNGRSDFCLPEPRCHARRRRRRRHASAAR